MLKNDSMPSRRTTINFERIERTFYRLADCEPFVAECRVCDEEVSWVTPNQAVALTGLPLREIFRRVEAHTVHFTETDPCMLHICPNSLGLK